MSSRESLGDVLTAAGLEIPQRKPPERIYGWLNGHLSIARHYGGCEFNGHKYVIAYDEPDQPLVRWDVLQRERKKSPGSPGGDR
jgi:hypothetical protein